MSDTYNIRQATWQHRYVDNDGRPGSWLPVLNIHWAAATYSLPNHTDEHGYQVRPLYDDAALEVARQEGRNESIAKLLHWEDGDDLYSYPADSNVVVVALPEFERMVNVEILHDQLRAQLQLATEALDAALAAERERCAVMSPDALLKINGRLTQCVRFSLGLKVQRMKLVASLIVR